MPDESNVKTVVIGVGPEDGLGAQLCARFLRRGHHVFMAGRTGETLEALARTFGGKATTIATDATDESQVDALFDAVDAADGELKLAIYNVGNNRPGPIADMESRYFERSLDVGIYGAFLFGREAVRRLRRGARGGSPRKKGGGTLIFTGASASLRGRANYGAFNASKGAQRALAQAMAKEYATDGVHVSHVVIDGPIGGEKIKQGLPEYAERLGEAGMISIQGIVDAYEFLYDQPPNAWTFELDIRTSLEKW
ncbi:MAG: SDR family NAD(P)-dependent oxidoreductase [Gammaproteobacteria bacterium]|nr:SDR family NAD(P)-dependent oxidoreductase [Gammaproteobacteria bacterium]